MKKLITMAVIAGSLMATSGCRKREGGPVSSGLQHVTVVMKKYSIEPAVIHVKAEERVQMDVSTADVQHGVLIPKLGINEPVQPGKPVTVSFVVPNKGEYEIKCGVICGPHHDDMLAKLIAE